MRQNTTTRTAQLNALKTGLAAGLLLGATLLAMPVRADEVSLEGQIANARVVGQVSAALSAYSHDVGTLAHTLSAEARSHAEAKAAADYRRLVWHVSGLQASASEAEADEFAAIQEMVVVYGEIEGRIASAGRAGNLGQAAHEAQRAAAVGDEIDAGLQQIANRGYAGLFQTAAVASPTRAASVTTTGVSRVAAAK